jgi:hypothetical protein
MASVNDNDVQLYLDELKGFIFSFGQINSTGTENLVELLNFMLDDIDNIKYMSQDKLGLLMKRYNVINSLLNSYTNLYQDSLIEERYIKYKEDNINISEESPYMYSIVRQLDLTMKDKVNNLADIRYESSFLLVNINYLDDIIRKCASLTDEINILIEKCNNT